MDRRDQPSGGTPKHYLCDEANGWLPDLDDIRAKITPKTKAIVVINPNNPTGALYPDELLKEIIAIAREHHLIIYSDEVHDKVLYDGNTHTAIASLSEDVLTITFNGLSKNYRSCGYRAGWMVVSGDKRRAKDYIEGLDMLASMRLCANAPGQHGIQTALGGYQSIDDLVAPGGRMCRQRDVAHELITAIPASPASSRRRRCTCSRASIRRCTRSRTIRISLPNCCRRKKVLLVQGTGFNWPNRTISAWCSCRTRMTCGRPSAALHDSSRATAGGMARPEALSRSRGRR